MNVSEIRDLLEQSGKKYREETLLAHCRFGTRAVYDGSDGKRKLAFWAPYVEFANGVRYFFDFAKWPESLQRTHRKVLAPRGPRGLLGSPGGFDELIACEGEGDWLTLIDRGFPNAITGGGAGNGHSVIAEASRGKGLTILFDRDEIGGQDGLRLARKAYGVARDVRIATLPEMRDGLKDISDFFNAHGGDADALKKLLTEAKEFVPTKQEKPKHPEFEAVVFHHCQRTGRIFDLVRVDGKPLFARFDPSTPTIDIVDRAGKDGRFRPIDMDAVRAGHIRFAGRPEPFESLPKLIQQVEAFIAHWVSVSAFFTLVSSRYVFLTYFYDRLQTVPYLRVLADRGRGKSRYEEVMLALCFRAVNMSGADTASPMFRLIRRYGPTMIIDEGDRRRERNSDTYSSVTKILNYGIHKTGVVWRTEVEGRNLIETPFPVYGPKILSSRERFGDSAVESRCITEVLPPKPKGSYEFSITPEFHQEAESLRNHLMYWRLTNWHREISPPERLSMAVEDRLNQIAAPLVQVMKLLDDQRGMKELTDHIEEMHQEFLEQRQQSDEGILLSKLREMASEGEHRVYCKDLAAKSGITRGKENAPITARAVGAILDRIGLKKGSDRNGRFVLLRDETLGPILEAYGLDPLTK